MRGKTKLLYILLTLITALSMAIWTTYHFSQTNPFQKSFQLAILTAVAVLVSSIIVYYLLLYLFYPLISHYGKRTKSKSKTKAVKVVPNRAKPDQKEKAKADIPDKERKKEPDSSSDDQKEELSTAEVLVVLPYELSFLLAKESIQNLAFGKIKKEDKASGIVEGSTGIVPSVHKIRLNIRSITEHSTVIDISIDASSREKSETDKQKFITKISQFLRNREAFYNG